MFKDASVCYKQTLTLVVVKSHLWQSRQSVVMQAGQLRMASLLGKPWDWRGCDRDPAAGRFLLYLHRKTRGRMKQRKTIQFSLRRSRLDKQMFNKITDSLRASYLLLLASTQAWSLSSSSGSYSSSSLVSMVRCLRLRPVELPVEEERDLTNLNLL